jgi:phosphomannomutase
LKLEKLVTSSDVSTDLPPAAPLERREVFEPYMEHLLAATTERGPRLKVAADAANGMGTLYLPFFERLNVDLVPLYFELDGTFPNHEANPLKTENLVDLQKALLEHGCHVGVAFDGDADRAMFVDEQGGIVTADMMTALLAPRYLAIEPGATIVYDLRSSWATKEAIEAAGGRAVRERVGHSFIKATMREHGSPFGGELAGHFYYRYNYTADSSMLTLIQLLNQLRETGQPLSSLVAPLKRYHATGEINFHVDDKKAMMEHLAEVFADGAIDWLDGVTVQYDDWWFNVRPSNTEPLLRLVLEARTADLMEERKKVLLGYLGTPE